MNWDLGAYVLLLLMLAMMWVPIARLVTKPLLTDKLLALNALTTQGVLVMALLAMTPGRSSYVDVAIVYALFGLVTMLGISLYIQRRMR